MIEEMVKNQKHQRKTTRVKIRQASTKYLDIYLYLEVSKISTKINDARRREHPRWLGIFMALKMFINMS